MNITQSQFHSAPRSITDSPSGNYGNNSNYTITSTNGLDLQNSPVAVINYWAKWSTEPGYDYTQFNLSGNNSSWTPQKGKYTKTGCYHEIQGQPLYDGNQPSWVREQIVTTNYSNELLKMQFILKSDANTNYDGFYFDDLTVTVVDMTKVGTGTMSTLRCGLFDPVPNPGSGKVTVRFVLDPGIGRQPYIFTMVDSRGIRVMEMPVQADQGHISFSVDHLSSGVYFYRIYGNFGTSEVKKLVVIH